MDDEKELSVIVSFIKLIVFVSEFEGHKIENLAGLSEWKQEKDQDEEEKCKEQDDFVLASLFKKSGRLLYSSFLYCAGRHNLINMKHPESHDYSQFMNEVKVVIVLKKTPNSHCYHWLMPPFNRSREF
jgi:hypothetical protein